MRWSPFSTRAFDRLAFDGALQAVRPGMRLRSIVLDRGRCIFGRFEPPGKFSRQALVQAARSFAEAEAPFENASAAIVLQRGRVGIWWWDADWVAARLTAAGVADRPMVWPEPLMQPVGDGWRIVAGASGWDAQCWRGGTLQVSTWRRRPYEPEDWIALVRRADRGGRPALPSPTSLRLMQGSAYGRARLAEASGPGFALAMVCGVVVMLASTVFFTVQAWRLNVRADAAEQALAAPSGGADRGARVRNAISELVRLRRAVSFADPLTLTERAQDIVGRFGLRVAGVTADRQSIVIRLPPAAAETIDQLAMELEASPYFAEVRPRIEGEDQAVVIEMAAEGEQVSSPPSPGG